MPSFPSAPEQIVQDAERGDLAVRTSRARPRTGRPVVGRRAEPMGASISQCAHVRAEFASLGFNISNGLEIDPIGLEMTSSMGVECLCCLFLESLDVPFS